MNTGGRCEKAEEGLLPCFVHPLSQVTICRVLVNAAYWATGLESKIPNKANVEYVGEFKPTMYGFGGYKKGVKPADFELLPPP